MANMIGRSTASQPTIHLPDKSRFPSADNYYATALHELGHWSGHASRLDRDLIHPFGSEGYAREELRAEIASMILGVELGIGHDPSQHAAYVGAWIKVLQDDPLEIFRAAADAEKIQGYVLGLEQNQSQEQTREQTREQVLGQVVDAGRSTAQDADSDAEKTVCDQKIPLIAATRSAAKSFIDVPFRQKDEARALGAKWDRQQQCWYVSAGLDPAAFSKWPDRDVIKAAIDPQRNAGNKTEAEKLDRERQYLAVPYGERVAARALGANWDKTAKSWYAGANAAMDKLERWKVDSMSAQQGPAMSPQQEFADALRFLGCIVDGDHPVMDGQKHRISVESEKHSEKAGSGFYVGFLDGHPAGYIKNNKTGIDMKWKAKGYTLEPAQKALMAAEAATKLQAREIEHNRLQEQAAQRIVRQMADLVSVVQPTPYMQAKGVIPEEGVFTDKGGRTTCIPAGDAEGKQWTMQYIQEDGTKRFAKNSRKEGCFHVIKGMDALARAPALVIAEGYATASSLSQSLGFATVAAFDSGNLPHVARALHAKFPDKPVIIAGDDDRHLEATQGVNLLPIFAPGEQEANPKGYTDFNDLANKSALGKEGIERQVCRAVDAIVEQYRIHVDQKAALQQRHGRSNGIG
jgi:putative DNA primase/helicase